MEINGKYYTDTEAAAYINMLLHLLADARPLLSMAFYVDYKMQHKADNVIFRIDQTLRTTKK